MYLYQGKVAELSSCVILMLHIDNIYIYIYACEEVIS